jgi:hypothetical protein
MLGHRRSDHGRANGVHLLAENLDRGGDIIWGLRTQNEIVGHLLIEGHLLSQPFGSKTRLQHTFPDGQNLGLESS